MTQHCSSTKEQNPKNQRQSSKCRWVSQSCALCACLENGGVAVLGNL